MAAPFYVSPDQVMQDKAEYARKGIAKGKSIVAMEYAGGLLADGGKSERVAEQNLRNL